MRPSAWGRAGWALACVGTAVMTVSPFLPDAHPLLNNYIPVLEQPAFLTGLAIAGVGFLVAVVFVRGFPDLRGRDASPIPDTEPVSTIT